MLRFNNLVILILVIIYCSVFITFIRKKKSLEYHIVFLAMYIYIAYVFKLVFFPIPVLKSSIDVYKSLESTVEFNIIPFKTIYDVLVYHSSGFVIQIIGNIVLFIPLGYLLPLLTSKEMDIKRMAFYSFIFSLGIEITQLTGSMLYGFTYKYFDIDDILLNVLGGLIGFVLLKLCISVMKKMINIDTSNIK